MNFNMSGLYKYQDGSYKDKNGNIVGYWNRKQSGLTGDAWRYLNSKYGKDWANRVSRNMQKGYIYENNEWRYDGNSVFNKMKNLVGSPGIEQNDTSKIKGIKHEDETAITKDDTATDALLKSIGVTGKTKDAAALGVYMVPVIGNVMSLLDAGKNIYDGNYGMAAFNAAMALPGLSTAKAVMKGAQLGGRALKAVGVANKFSKGITMSPKWYNRFKLMGRINTGTGLGLLGNMGVGLGLTYGPSMYNNYQQVKENKQYIPYLLNSYDQLDQNSKDMIKAMSTSNSFLGDLKAAYNLTNLQMNKNDNSLQN